MPFDFFFSSLLLHKKSLEDLCHLCVSWENYIFSFLPPPLPLHCVVSVPQSRACLSALMPFLCLFLFIILGNIEGMGGFCFLSWFTARRNCFFFSIRLVTITLSVKEINPPRGKVFFVRFPVASRTCSIVSSHFEDFFSQPVAVGRLPTSGLHCRVQGAWLMGIGLCDEP